ncbi:hypothetical protein DSECCO2_442570 [anaerobic digester metagenome]
MGLVVKHRHLQLQSHRDAINHALNGLAQLLLQLLQVFHTYTFISVFPHCIIELSV